MRRQLKVAAVLAVASLVVVTGCSSGGSNDSSSGSTLVWSNSGEPDTLDPAYATAGVAWVPAGQIFEGLVTTSDDGLTIEPKLAKEWSVDDSGLNYTFELQPNVAFTDGTPFNGEAVCANFDRWYNFSGIQQSSGVSYWYQSVFGGFANNEDGSDTPSLYASCEAPNETTATVTLTRPSASFIPALSMVPFSMVSPEAVEKYQGNEVGGTSEAPNLGTSFGTEHPIGTGPYTLEAWERGQQIDLEVNSDYWGDAPEVSHVTIQSLTDSTAKFQAFQAGNLDGYQNVSASDRGQLEQSEAANLYTSDPYTVGYVGFNPSMEPFNNPKLREAITHALDRKTIVSSMFDQGSVEATQLTPSATDGFTSDLPNQDYDPELAKEILADAGLTDITIDFAYPSGVSRPYMPNPSNIFQAFQQNLEDVGITVNPVEIPWGQYSAQLLGGKLGMYLWGSVGSYPSASYFLNLYASQTRLPDELQTQVDELIQKADAEPEQAKRVEVFEQINSLLMDNYVAVPYAEPASTTVLSAKFGNFIPNPYGNIDFAALTVEG